MAGPQKEVASQDLNQCSLISVSVLQTTMLTYLRSTVLPHRLLHATGETRCCQIGPEARESEDLSQVWSLDSPVILGRSFSYHMWSSVCSSIK